MLSSTPARTCAFAILTSLTCAAAIAGGACGGNAPSDQGGTNSGAGGSTSSSSSTGTTSSSNGGTGGAKTDGGGTGGAPDCYPNPMTYLEIINACTNAQQVDVMPVLPLLEADGGLPPLP
jgi:hypothetical protein